MLNNSGQGYTRDWNRLKKNMPIFPLVMLVLFFALMGYMISRSGS